MKCPYCDFELPEGSRFCSECGKDLSMAAAQPEEAPAAAETAETEAAQDAAEDPTAAETITDAAAAEESGEESPVFQECSAEEAIVEESIVEESSAEEPAAQDPIPEVSADAAQSAPAPVVPMMESASSGTTTVYHGVLDKKPEKNSRWATIGTWGWIGILLLLSIPVVNLIFLFAWSFGGAKKQVKQSFARATLILTLLTSILAVVSAILMYHYGPTLLERLFQLLSA